MDAKQRAEKLDSEGKCIVCEVETAERTRGLCSTDYSRFLAARRQIPKEGRPDFELMLIAQGRLLPSRQGQRTTDDDDVFAEAAAEFLSLTAGGISRDLPNPDDPARKRARAEAAKIIGEETESEKKIKSGKGKKRDSKKL